MDWEKLAELLTNLEFIEAKCAASMCYDLAEDFSTAMRVGTFDGHVSRALGELHAFLRLEGAFLAENPTLAISSVSVSAHRSTR